MEHENPYKAPETETELAQEQTYQPKFLSFSGRLNRARFICYTVALLLLMVAPFFAAIFVMQIAEDLGKLAMVIAFILFIGFIILNIGLVKRRFNDIGHSGWWAIFAIVPYIGGAVLLYLMFAASDKGSNEWGLPADTSNSLKIPLIFCSPIYMLTAIAGLFGNDTEGLKQFANMFFY